MFVATPFLRLSDSAELPLRRVSSFLRRQAIGDFFLDTPFKMLPHLLGHFGFEVSPAEKRAEFGKEGVHDLIRRYSARSAVIGSTFVARRAGR